MRVPIWVTAGFAAVMSLIAVAGVSQATAAPAWKAPMTVAKVRGIPDPMVAIDRQGKATAVE